MNFTRIRSHSAGVGMLEMVVAGALGMIVLVGASRMIKMSTDSARRADVKSEAMT